MIKTPYAPLLELLRGAYGARDPRLTPIHDSGDDATRIFRVDSDSDRAPPWVLRLFPATRPFERVEGDAAILRFLRDLPVEQVVDDRDGRGAVALDGRGVVVTYFINGDRARPSAPLLQHIGAIVGAIQARGVPRGDPYLNRRAGALPEDDLAFARSCLDDVREHGVPSDQRRMFERLAEDIAATHDCEGLPHRLVHSDCHLGNVIESSQGPVLFDWEGAGQGPAVAALGWLLYSTAVHTPDAGEADQAPFELDRVDALLSGYTAHATLTGEELRRLPDAMRFRPLAVAARAFRDSMRTGEPLHTRAWWSAYTDVERVANHALHYFERLRPSRG